MTEKEKLETQLIRTWEDISEKTYYIRVSLREILFSFFYKTYK